MMRNHVNVQTRSKMLLRHSEEKMASLVLVKQKNMHRRNERTERLTQIMREGIRTEMDTLHENVPRSVQLIILGHTTGPMVAPVIIEIVPVIVITEIVPVIVKVTGPVTDHTKVHLVIANVIDDDLGIILHVNAHLRNDLENAVEVVIGRGEVFNSFVSFFCVPFYLYCFYLFLNVACV